VEDAAPLALGELAVERRSLREGALLGQVDHEVEVPVEALQARDRPLRELHAADLPALHERGQRRQVGEVELVEARRARDLGGRRQLDRGRGEPGRADRHAGQERREDERGSERVVDVDPREALVGLELVGDGLLHQVELGRAVIEALDLPRGADLFHPEPRRGIGSGLRGVLSREQREGEGGDHGFLRGEGILRRPRPRYPPDVRPAAPSIEKGLP
jgi:hypothetical protein